MTTLMSYFKSDEFLVVGSKIILLTSAQLEYYTFTVTSAQNPSVSGLGIHTVNLFTYDHTDRYTRRITTQTSVPNYVYAKTILNHNAGNRIQFQIK